jgi:uncharacterized protein (DUF427 family)
MKAIFNNVVVAESDDTVVLEGDHYFPEAALKREYTSFSNHRTSDWRGQARYLSLLVSGELKTDAIWYYEAPNEAAAQLKGRVAFARGVQIVE